MQAEIDKLNQTIERLIGDNTALTKQVTQLTNMLEERDFKVNAVTHHLKELREINTVVRDCIMRFSNENDLTGLMGLCTDYLVHYYNPDSVTFYINDNALGMNDNYNEKFSHMFEFKMVEDFKPTKAVTLSYLFNQMLKSQQNIKPLSSIDVAKLEEPRTEFAVIAKVQYSNKTIGFILLEFSKDTGLTDLNLISILVEVFAINFSVLTVNSILAKKYDDALTQSLFDVKTGIPNSRHLMADLNQMGEKTYCIVSMDIDDFKLVNDNHGHDSGDEVLMFVAKTIDSCMISLGGRGYREGGDEFIGLSSSSLTETEREVEKMIETISNHVFTDKQGKTFSITNSVGLYRREDGEDHEIVKKKVDILLYISKEKGKKQVTTNQEVTIS